jgi:O-antigen/teichoic acid export membrane protein
MAALILFALNDILKVGMNIEARTHLLPIRVALAATLNVILGVIMIPRWGIVGAAAATMISYLFMDAFTIWACRNFYRIKYDWWSVGKLGVLATALLLVPSLVPLDRMVLDLGLKCVLLGIFLLATLHITKIDLTSLLRRSPGGIA